MTAVRTTPAAALTATLGLAAAYWVVSVWQMTGMDMDAATRLGSFAFFAAASSVSKRVRNRKETAL